VRDLSAGNKAAIRASRINKLYGSVLALHDFDLDVPYGHIHGLVGPNGAGKSTALRILSGVTQPSGGAAFVSGFDVKVEPEKAKAIIGYFPEDPSGYDALTVREFLSFIARLYGTLPSVADRRINRYTHEFKLEEQLEKYVGELSRGSISRVVLCSLFIHEPKVFILDDPFNSLDPYSSWLLRRMLVERRNQRRAILIATHMLDIAEKICDSFTILDHGETIATGTLQGFRAKLGLNSLEEIFLKLTSRTYQ
jgi:ABC-2 type transport system ATP-binding protein